MSTGRRSYGLPEGFAEDAAQCEAVERMALLLPDPDALQADTAAHQGPPLGSYATQALDAIAGGPRLCICDCT